MEAPDVALGGCVEIALMTGVWQPAGPNSYHCTAMNGPPKHEDIVPPDPRVRTAAIIVVAAGMVVGLFLLGFVRRYVAGLEDLVQQNPEEAARRIGAAVRVLTWAAAIPPVAAALTMMSIAIRAWRSERYPPPGARPIRAVRVRTGPAARRIAAMAGVLALLLLGATVFLVSTLRDIERWMVTLGGT